MGKEMKLDKYVTLLSTIIFCGIGTNGHADEINFTGTISEFTCTQQSKDKGCMEFQKTMDSVKTKLQSDLGTKLPNQAVKIANISLDNTTNQYSKVLVVSYN